MSIHPEGESCSDMGSSCRSQWPYLVGCAGSKGEVAVWDILSESAVAEGPYGAQLEKFNRAAAGLTARPWSPPLVRG